MATLTKNSYGDLIIRDRELGFWARLSMQVQGWRLEMELRPWGESVKREDWRTVEGEKALEEWKELLKEFNL